MVGKEQGNDTDDLFRAYTAILAGLYTRHLNVLFLFEGRELFFEQRG